MAMVGRCVLLELGKAQLQSRQRELRALGQHGLAVHTPHGQIHEADALHRTRAQQQLLLRVGLLGLG